LDHYSNDTSKKISGETMRKVLTSSILWGTVLVIGGVLLLLDSTGVFKGGALFWTIVLGVVGILFLWFYFTNRDHWWSLIPGVILLGVSATIGLSSFLPGFDETNFVGTIILGSIALSFLLVYLTNRNNWWAIIPAGVMATIAVVATLDVVTTGLASGGIFFLGLGITFAIVAILPNPVGQMRWAWIPAGILGIFGLILFGASEQYLNYVWPIALLLAGIYLIIRSLTRK
jgi:uncharacterized membrane protein HdeD (DUF308 family)